MNKPVRAELPISPEVSKEALAPRAHFDKLSANGEKGPVRAEVSKPSWPALRYLRANGDPLPITHFDKLSANGGLQPQRSLHFHNGDRNS